MFHPIDMTTWERAERYRHYMDTARCTYSLTAMVDIAALYRGAKERGLRLTPCLTYLSARAVNARGGAVPAAALAPSYLRLSQAERERAARGQSLRP